MAENSKSMPSPRLLGDGIGSRDSIPCARVIMYQKVEISAWPFYAPIISLVDFKEKNPFFNINYYNDLMIIVKRGSLTDYQTRPMINNTCM